ncbi:hypothetical protein EVG20_g7367 [Dentipellis fragilis]|uniref:Uncharacterized protein n=1 Tax=Dentipellis fragilis TaxID=205917 RepID=A0A4Y9YDI7_9AGAM|nr:hypothetical protein EVG20_g7367 [Dentipellis fragilis]
MSGNGSDTLPLDKAGIISTVLEGILYGFSVFMYGVTLWVLFHRRSTSSMVSTKVSVCRNYASCIADTDMGSLQHIGNDIARIIDGLVYNRDFMPGGPAVWFENPSDFTFVFKSALYALQTITGDGVMIYRCYVVWQNVWIVVVPVIMLCSVIATAVGSVWACSQATPSQAGIFAEQISQWITACYALTLTTNVICTTMLAFRIWQINSEVTRNIPGASRSSLMPIVFVVVDAGILYLAALLSALLCFVNKSNGQYIVLDMIMPIISIAFYMVIVRVGLAQVNASSRGGTSSGAGPLNYANTRVQSPVRADFIVRPLEVHITQLTESQKDSPRYQDMGDSISKSEIDSSSNERVANPTTPPRTGKTLRIMSDEYASTGFKGSLADDSIDTMIDDHGQRNTQNAPDSDYATNNYPPPGDTTSSGGSRQRPAGADSGLLDQSPSGGSLGKHVEDAKQGRDECAREQLNPYSGSSLEGREEAGEALASRYADARGRNRESGGVSANDEDVGA